MRAHSRSGERFTASGQSLFGGVPMSWRLKWPGGFPVVVRRQPERGHETWTATSTWTCASGTPAQWPVTGLPPRSALWPRRRRGAWPPCCPPRTRRGWATSCADDSALAALNRGVLLTPFHNMALMSPATTEADVDRHTEVFRETVEAVVGA